MMYLIHSLAEFYRIFRSFNIRVNKTFLFTQLKNGLNEDYNVPNDYDTEHVKGTATNILNAIAVLNM